MKIENKQIIIILVSVAVVFSVFGYIAKGTMTPILTGYMVLMDHEPVVSGNLQYTTQQYTTSIFLPSDNCNSKATICGYDFPYGVNPAIDVNRDGRIDFVDLYLFLQAYHTPPEDYYSYFNITKCIFDVKGPSFIGDVRFEDPDRDCQMTIEDINNITAQWRIPGSTDPYSSNCNERCRTDLNKDNRIDSTDLVLALIKYKENPTSIAGMPAGGYADEYLDFSYLRPIDFDFNKDGKVTSADVLIFIGGGNPGGVRNFGAVATKQECYTAPVDHVSGNEYTVTGTGYGIYHISVAYLCTT